MTRLRFLVGVVLGLALLTSTVHTQGPFTAQIQAALRAFVRSNQTITGNWTCTGTCTGFSGSAPSVAVRIS